MPRARVPAYSDWRSRRYARVMKPTHAASSRNHFPDRTRVCLRVAASGQDGREVLLKPEDAIALAAELVLDAARAMAEGAERSEREASRPELKTR
jgi:hypothetical protein